MTADSNRGQKIAEAHARRREHKAGKHTSQKNAQCKMCIEEVMSAQVGAPTEAIVAAPIEDTAPVTEAAEDAPSSEEPETITVHFLKDGVTGMGRLFYLGEELTVTVGSPEWKKSLDKDGNSWLTQSPERQKERFGEIHWALGPWPYEKVNWDEEKYLDSLTEAQKVAIKKLEGTGGQPLVARGR